MFEILMKPRISERKMKGKLRGTLDRRWEIRIQNKNETPVNSYNWIKCLRRQKSSDARQEMICLV